VGYAFTTTIAFPVRLGGRSGAATYDGAWLEVTSNYLSGITGALYPLRASFERPEVPAAARDAVAVGGTATYAVYPPHEELVEVAP
jgi:hypothetical protein